MSELARRVAAVLAEPTAEDRRRALARIPPHLRADVEAQVRRLWPQRPAPRKREDAR
ncbi:MAG: hypothetical protein MUC77_03635 [Chromatiaceae bacterium]|jgi:hypothetical protein|nr:hypothetical protein [Chromatiaceae bacterium]